MKIYLPFSCRERTGSPDYIKIKLPDDSKDKFWQFIKKHERWDKFCHITYDNTITRSLPQNAFFHGPFLEAVMKWSGDMDKEYWKSYFKREFLRYQNPEGKWITGHTSDLDVHEFSAFLDNCIHKFWDMGGHFDAECSKKYIDMQNEVGDLIRKGD